MNIKEVTCREFLLRYLLLLQVEKIMLDSFSLQ